MDDLKVGRELDSRVAELRGWTKLILPAGAKRAWGIDPNSDFGYPVFVPQYSTDANDALVLLEELKHEYELVVTPFDGNNWRVFDDMMHTYDYEHENLLVAICGAWMIWKQR